MNSILSTCLIRLASRPFVLTAKAKAKIARALDPLPASYDFWSKPELAVNLLAAEYNFPEEKKRIMAACMLLTIYYKG